MFTLVTEKSRFFRVKRGQDADEIERVFQSPVSGKAFSGRIIEIKSGLYICTANVGETYRTLALKTGVPEETLREVNGGKPVYPTCRIFVPRKDVR